MSTPTENKKNDPIPAKAPIAEKNGLNGAHETQRSIDGVPITPAVDRLEKKLHKHEWLYKKLAE